MWDEAAGSGMLGLRNVRITAAAVLGKGVRPGQVQVLAREIKSLCEGRLDVLRHGRNWRERPMVFDMDWMVAAGKKRRKGNVS